MPASDHYLRPLLAPRSVAVVGASPRPASLGRIVFENLRSSGFKGAVHAVNPKHRRIGEADCLRRLADLPGPVDLAVVCTPAATLERVLEDAGRAGLRHALVLSAGFGETGDAGRALERRVAESAKRLGIRLLGPNCLGIMRPSIGLNATFARRLAAPGPMALISQSGAVATAMVDWAAAAGIGFSSVVSLGAAVDVDFGELLDFFVHDAETRAILLYIEGIHDARRFLSALRAAARAKPVIAMKVGRHLSGSRAAMSHTGALVGVDAVFDAALERSGVLRALRWSDLFDAARVIGAGRRTAGNRLAVVTNGGGPGVMAADHAVECGVELAALAPATRAVLDAALPAHWSHANPVDLIGDADAARFTAALDALLADPGVDGVVTLFCPQQVLTGKAAAEAIVASARRSRKPVLTVWLGEADVREGREFCEAAHVPVFTAPEPAVAAFGGLAAHARAQAALLEIPAPHRALARPDTGPATAIAANARAEGRRLLDEVESKRLLTHFGIPVPESVVVRTAAEALEAARRIGYPLAMKILSRAITHKSDVRGVRLGVADPGALEREFAALLADVARLRPDAPIDGVVLQPQVTKRFGREVMIGIATDPVFGPVVSFGAGGVAVERLGDQAVGLPPLNARLAATLIERTRVARLLGAYRQVPAAATEALIDILLRVSEMACALPWIAEMDINPILVDQDGAVALDCRVVISELGGNGGVQRPCSERGGNGGVQRPCSELREADARYAHMAIHPYPARLETTLTLRGAAVFRVRPIRPEDAQSLQAFVGALSDESRYLRFFNSARELPAAVLARFTQVDYDRELALVAEPMAGVGEPTAGAGVPTAAAGVPTAGVGIAAVARYAPNPDGLTCEFALTVADAWQGMGLGRQLLDQLCLAAAEAGYLTMTGGVLKSNEKMLALLGELGWERTADPEDAQIWRVSRTLEA